MEHRDEVAIGKAAIKRAIRALRKRHLLEEGAHGYAVAALSRPFAVQGLEWKEKVENLELELQQCYKAQSRLSEQLVVEVAECRTAKAFALEKEATLTNIQNEITQLREENLQLKEALDEKTNALELSISENQAIKVQLEEVSLKLKTAESEYKSLIDRWMLEKMKDAEKLNEANAIYEEMVQRLKINSIEQLARQQVDGVVRRSEGGYHVESPIPSKCRHVISAHGAACGSILFQNNSDKLISGGQDQTVKIWDTTSGVLSCSLHGCIGSVYDLAVTHDNKSVIAASGSNNLFVWEIASGRLRHTLTGHTAKVCAVDTSNISSRNLASAASDHTIKFWDLQKGYCVHTIMSSSNCNALSYSMDGVTICSGHVDGNLRVWDIQTGLQTSEVAAHSQMITSICISQNGKFVLTSGKDNTHNLFDVRSSEICGTFRANGNTVVSNWSRSCMSPDGNYVAAGSSTGSVHIWSTRKAGEMSVLEGRSSPILSCSWSGLGQPLAAADRDGTVSIWR